MSRPSSRVVSSIAITVAIATSPIASAAGAPGEDPITIRPGTNPLAGLLGARTPDVPSVPLDQRTGTSPGSRARVARFEATAFSIDEQIDGAASTVRQAAGDGLRTVCVTEIAGGTATGPRGDQIVVIRGNVINVCR